MDDGIIILLIVAGIILQGFFLYVVIRWAMQAKRQIWNQRQQLNILIEIAKKLDATGNFDVEGMKLMNNNSTDQYLK